MEGNMSIYQDIATRTGGDIYIGVVGPVRTGKSTFIKRFMESTVLPQMEEGGAKSRAKDEMPQSGSGKTVMTTEPKFVPDEGVRINLGDSLGFRVKLIDCVGFVVPDAQGLEEEGAKRMVNTPWSDQALPFDEAAKLGTQKVMKEHSTVGIVVTTDGSIGELPRDSFLEAEEEVIGEMKKTQKPFVILLNSAHPKSEETLGLCTLLEEKYKVPVLAVNCILLEEEDVREILRSIVLEFPIRRAKVSLPSWILSLPDGHKTKEAVMEEISSRFLSMKKTGELTACLAQLNALDLFENVRTVSSDLGCGCVEVEILPERELFWEVLSDSANTSVHSEEELMEEFCYLAKQKAKLEKIAEALAQVEETGYGIVKPELEDLTLEEPEIVKKAGGYGVKLKASAPSIHMIRADIQAEISPIVGSERQSEDIVKFLLEEFEEDPTQIWQSNLFGKSLYELVSESLNTKLNHMPAEARQKLGETLQKIINEGSGGLICIIL